MLCLHVLMTELVGIKFWIYLAGLSGPQQSLSLRITAGSHSNFGCIFNITALRWFSLFYLLFSLTGTFKVRVRDEDDPKALKLNVIAHLNNDSSTNYGMVHEYMFVAEWLTLDSGIQRSWFHLSSISMCVLFVLLMIPSLRLMMENVFWRCSLLCRSTVQMNTLIYQTFSKIDSSQ